MNQELVEFNINIFFHSNGMFQKLFRRGFTEKSESVLFVKGWQLWDHGPSAKVVFHYGHQGKKYS